jgi:hypothetical protein
MPNRDDGVADLSTGWLGVGCGRTSETMKEDLMITYQCVRNVNRSAEDTFDVIGTHMYENHPRWEPEVIEIRRITPGPVGVGSRAVMVRHEFGRTREVEYVITEFEEGRRIASQHPDDALDFNISFEIAPIDRDSCTVRVNVRAQPKGWTRILEPMMRLVMPKRGQRIANAMVDVIESAPART